LKAEAEVRLLKDYIKADCSVIWDTYESCPCSYRQKPDCPLKPSGDGKGGSEGGIPAGEAKACVTPLAAPETPEGKHNCYTCFGCPSFSVQKIWSDSLKSKECAYWQSKVPEKSKDCKLFRETCGYWQSGHRTESECTKTGKRCNGLDTQPEISDDFGKFYGEVEAKYCPICNEKIPMKIANDGTFIGWGEHKCRTEIIEAYNRGKNDCPEVKQEDEVKRLYDIIENMKKCCKGWRCVERELCKNGIPFIYDEAPCGRLTCIGCTKFASGCEYIEKSKSYFINRAWFNFNFKKDNWHSCDDHGPDFKCYGDDDCDGPVCRREADDRVKAAEQCAESSRMCANDSQVRWEKGQAEIDKLISELKYVKEKYVWTKITEKKYQADKKKFEARAKK
jgi:hypothetical protein